MRVLRLFALIVLGALVCAAGLPREAAGQATPMAPAAEIPQPTALFVSAIHAPLRVTGSDGMVHIEYDLVLANVFTSLVTLTAIDVLAPEDRSLLRLDGDALAAVTQPLLGRTPTTQIPDSGAVAVVVDVAVPPDQAPERLTHRITYELTPDAQYATIIGSQEIAGPELAVDHFAPVVIASPLRGTGWVNANGCCDPSDHRSFRLAIAGSRIVQPETFAIDWMRIQDGRLFAGDGARNEDYFAFGEEALAVAAGTVVAVRDGMAENTPGQAPTTLHRPLDYGGNHVVIELASGVYAFYAHFQPGSLRVQTGDTVTTGQVLGLVGNTGNSTAPHLHFALLDGPDGLTANSLPFVIDAWTLEGTIDPNASPTDVQAQGASGPQHETLPLDQTLADFG
jgi:hypothetical protein